jgi:hypothetical protein
MSKIKFIENAYKKLILSKLHTMKACPETGDEII